MTATTKDFLYVADLSLEETKERGGACLATIFFENRIVEYPYSTSGELVKIITGAFEDHDGLSSLQLGAEDEDSLSATLLVEALGLIRAKGGDDALH